jgi:2-polyprenyl-3-methyl-5-hydroxy-6-metoxy-1,4-benzoquinol methylase
MTVTSPHTAVPDGQSHREERWKEEARFFDELARNVDESTLTIDPLALQRYSRAVLRNRFNKEFRFRLLGQLMGKRLLDIGCGDGLNAVMFAKMGAHVTGLDVSSGAIQLARRRAEVNGVSERTTFICAPVENADLAPDSFDIVWGDAILHHVLAELELVLQHVARWCKPSGLILFSEPVNLANALRRLRSVIPIHTDATPDERPLVRAELDLVNRYIPDLRLRHYGLFGRLDPFILTNFNYERSSMSRKVIVNGIDLADYALLSLPLVKRLGGVCVMYGRPNKFLSAERGRN